MTMSAGATFRKHFDAQLARELGWAHFPSTRTRQTTLIRPVRDGLEKVVLAGSNKWSPLISVDFYYGKHFTAAAQIEKSLGMDESSFHVMRYSINEPRPPDMKVGMFGEKHCSWTIDITQPSPTAVEDVASGIKYLMASFMDHVGNAETARNALANGEIPGFSGPYTWRAVLAFDLSLSDLAHFQKWYVQLEKSDRDEADRLIERHVHQFRVA